MSDRKKSISTVCSVLALLVAVSSTAAISGEEILRTNQALEDYKKLYLKAKDQKAFAQSRDGAWAWQSDRTTVQIAREDALRKCNSFLSEGEEACSIVNVNGNWVTKP